MFRNEENFRIVIREEVGRAMLLFLRALPQVHTKSLESADFNWLELFATGNKVKKIIEELKRQERFLDRTYINTKIVESQLVELRQLVKNVKFVKPRKLKETTMANKKPVMKSRTNESDDAGPGMKTGKGKVGKADAMKYKAKAAPAKKMVKKTGRGK